MPQASPVAEMIASLEERANVLESGLRWITTAASLDGDDPLSVAYREAGGGYEGLQAIADRALAIAETKR
jgi:hypothetical protein